LRSPVRSHADSIAQKIPPLIGGDTVPATMAAIAWSS
jgi:hypothetical protein